MGEVWVCDYDEALVSIDGNSLLLCLCGMAITLLLGCGDRYMYHARVDCMQDCSLCWSDLNRLT